MILITYNLRNNIENLHRFVDSLKSKREILLVVLNILGCEKVDINVEPNIRIEWLNVDPMDAFKTAEITLSLMANPAIQSSLNIEENVSFLLSLDEYLSDKTLEDQNIAIVYSDFEVQLSNGCLLPILNTCYPPKIESIPAVFVKKYPEEIFRQAYENKINYHDFLSRIFITKHIPKTVFRVWHE